MSAVADQNQFDVLSSPSAEGKSASTSSGRFSKDDMKEQAYAAREGIKSRVANLKEQVVGSGLVDQLSGALDAVKQKAGISDAQVDDAKAAASQVKAKASAAASSVASKDPQELADDAAEGWETVKRRGKAQAAKAAQQADAKLDEKLTPDQRAKLNKNARMAANQAMQLERQAEGWSDKLIVSLLRGPQLRGAKNFIRRNRLQLPVVLLSFGLTLWLGLSLIRFATVSSQPAPPAFDIHSAENTAHWLKYWGGEYAGKAAEMQTSLAGRATAFLANYEWEKVKDKLSMAEYREIGMKKLGLSEPTWSEWLVAKLTGRPITWQDRVNVVLSSARAGIHRPDILQKPGIIDRVKNMLHPREPTMSEKATDYVDSMLHRQEPTLSQKAAEYVRENILHQHEPTLKEKAALKAAQAAAYAANVRIPGLSASTPEPEGIVDGLKNKLADGYDSLRTHLPGADAYLAAKQAAYDAAHPSTLDQIKSGANYVKNRIVHGAQEAGHIAQDRANEASDKAKWKLGL